jgi:hypothetical protein
MDNKYLFNRKSLKPLSTSLRNRSTSAESVLKYQLKSKNPEGIKFRSQQSIGNKKINHPGRESRIADISKSTIPATPPSKGGETYIFIIQIIIVIFDIKIFLRLTAMGFRGKVIKMSFSNSPRYLKFAR